MNRNANIARNRVLSVLADGEFHSGEILGKELGLSRAAISKHVKLLGTLGLDIYSVTGKGYKLSQPLQFLQRHSILQHIPDSHDISLEVLNVIDSTNGYLKDKIGDMESGHMCLAEAQTAGRGRHGRTWVSPYGASLYLSCYWSFSAGYQAIGGLSLAVGVALADALEIMGVNTPQLKWPNDLYLQDKKVAGVLVEVEGQMGAGCDCIIGVGLNIDLPENQSTIDQPWTDLAKVMETTIDRNRLAAEVIKQLVASVALFESDGLAPFISKWRQLDLYKDKRIKMTSGNTVAEGIGRGVNDNGGLLVEVDGIEKAFYGGEISVRKA